MDKNGLFIEEKGKIAIIHLQNPPANTLSQEVCQALCEALGQLQGKVQVIVITGNEKFFCAGADIKTFSLEKPEENEAYFEWIYTALQTVYDCSVPVIAAVNGVAMGGGMELALCCDLRIVDEDLRMGATSANLGLVFCTQRLPRLIGISKASELLLTARVFQGEEARDLGIAHAVAPSGQALAEAMVWAETIAQKPQFCLEKIKQSLRQGTELPLSQALQQEKALLFMAFQDSSFRERVTKFLQKDNERGKQG